MGSPLLSVVGGMAVVGGEGLGLKVREKVGDDGEVGERSRLGWVGPLGAGLAWRPLGSPCSHAPQLEGPGVVSRVGEGGGRK